MPSQRARPDLVIVGRIASLSEPAGLGWVEALAIADGRISAAGAADDVEPLIGPDTEIWRLDDGELVLPSITDAHLHLTAAALATEQLDLTDVDQHAAIAAIVAEHERRLERSDIDSPILGHGWSVASLGAHPTAGWLDEAAPGRPVALWSHDHHSRWLSARAVQLAALSARADPDGGRIERDDDGRPTGVMYEAAAGLVDAAIEPTSANDIDRAIGAFARTLAALGITSVHDPGDLAPDPTLERGPVLYGEMARAGRLPLRVVASVREEQLGRAIELGLRSGRAEADPPSGRYRDGWLKLFADGALGSRTAALLAPYEAADPSGPPPGGPQGMLLRSGGRLAELVEQAATAGIASQIHAIGDAAVRSVLDVLETAPRVDGVMHRIEHAQLVDAADWPRFAGGDIAASVQPVHLTSDAAAMHAAWGDRTAHAFPLAAISSTGTSMPFGSDAPVEPADPWPGIAVAVTRRGPGRPADPPAFHPEQAISLERALRSACLDGPRSAGISDQGHLGIGARADLIVVPSETLSEPPDADVLGRTRPLATLLDGQVIHRAATFDP